MNKVRILVADDHEVVRQGVKTLLANEGWDVCAEASNGHEAIEKAHQCQPDVAVIDFTMPGLNGVDATRRLLEVSPKTRVIMLTLHDSEQIEREVVAAGGHGYVLKSSTAQDLATGVRVVLQGRPFFRAVLHKSVHGVGALKKTPFELLSPREREIAQLLAEGNTVKTIAEKLDIGATTVETHRASLMRKLGLHSVVDLTRYAIRNKLIEP